MKLTEADRVLLFAWNYDESDFNQIEEATRKTTYEYNGDKIGREKVIELIGRREFLSGIARSAFHRSAVRQAPDNDDVTIYFDSSGLFR